MGGTEHTKSIILKYWPQLLTFALALMAYGEARYKLSNVVDKMPHVVTNEKAQMLEEKYKNRMEQIEKINEAQWNMLRGKASKAEMGKIEEVLENKINTNHRRQSKGNDRRDKMDARLRDVEKVVY